jgi:tetratricopeptide (TPR) repeat protein
MLIGCTGLVLAACSGPAPRPYPAATTVRKPEAVAPAVPIPAPKPLADPRGDPESRFQLALQAMKDGQRDAAHRGFDALAHDFPQFSGPLSDLGVLQAHDRQYDAAITSFASATSANGKNAFAWGWLGILYRERGDYAHAEQAYRQALALRPDDATAHYNLGILYDVYLRRPNEALVQYREYQRLSSSGEDDKRLIVAVWIRQIENGRGDTRLASAEGAP